MGHKTLRLPATKAPVQYHTSCEILHPPEEVLTGQLQSCRFQMRVETPGFWLPCLQDGAKNNNEQTDPNREVFKECVDFFSS